MTGYSFLNQTLLACLIALHQKRENRQMSYDYSENVLVQDSAGHLIDNESRREVKYVYNTESSDNESN